MKTCRVCEIPKPPTEYYVHRGMVGGLLKKCKSCCRLQANDYYHSNRERIREQRREK